MLVLLLNMLVLAAEEPVEKQVAVNEIHLRDPFVLPVPEEKKYYIFGTGFQGLPDGPGFATYWSSDLVTWHGPHAVFRRPEGFWGTRDYWAPEVHRYQGKYYMFASFCAKRAVRATQILVADTPAGPYRLHSDGPVTPKDWFCLDGTLYLDPEGKPWIVFCHEWVQIHDGEICAQRLSKDLRHAKGKPTTLFKASDAPWVGEMGFGTPKAGFITDGPFLFRAKDGALLMLWSSFGKDRRYKQAVARSASGKLEGPWTHPDKPIFEDDGGHGMIFQTFDGQTLLSLHQPNNNPKERPRFFTVEEDRGSLKLTPK
ncbi:MAG TPA: glycoside hydrolase family 43 protein [Candidatus Hydrogenedentes bacterium]|nr:glycoside hydrolase family 43 protein [Candidatus Hydrogenedentota bacterium]